MTQQSYKAGCVQLSSTAAYSGVQLETATEAPWYNQQTVAVVPTTCDVCCLILSRVFAQTFRAYTANCNRLQARHFGPPQASAGPFCNFQFEFCTYIDVTPDTNLLKQLPCLCRIQLWLNQAGRVSSQLSQPQAYIGNLVLNQALHQVHSLLLGKVLNWILTLIVKVKATCVQKS